MPTKRLCSVDGCDKPHSAHGFCMAHYRRWQRHGHHLAGGKPGNRKFPARLCSVVGCGDNTHSRGLCRGHYTKWWRYGDASISLKPTQNKAVPWLLANVKYEEKGCLIWPFCRNKKSGHGKILFKGKDMPASRAMCIAAHGEPPTPKHQAAHSCGKAHEGCVNPTHLRWALPLENHQDAALHGTRKILTIAQREEMKRLAETMTVSDLAKKYQVHVNTIYARLSGNRRPKYT